MSATIHSGQLKPMIATPLPGSSPSSMSALAAVRTCLRYSPQVVVTPEGLGRKLRRVEELTASVVASASGPVLASGGGARRSGTDFADPETDVEKTLAGFWADSLGVEDIGLDDDFFEMGGNSLVAVQLGTRVRNHFQVQVTMNSLFESSTVRKLAAVFDDAILTKISAMSDSEVQAALQSPANALQA